MMEKGLELRAYAHAMLDRMSDIRIKALLDLIDEDFFSEAEMAEIQELRNSEEWTDWREVRNDV